jgi:ABC-type polysaccharide/polyol phosphate export permease
MKYDGAIGPAYDYDSSRRGPLALEELHGIWKYRELILQLVRRDIVTRYKRSALGLAWTLLNPLGMMLILTIVFSQLFHTVRGYPVYILSGLIAWTFFSQATTASLSQNIWGSSLLHRIYLPRTAFTISAIGTGLANLVLSLIPLFLIVFLTGYPLHATMLFLPVSMLILGCFALGVGLLLSTLALYFPDVVDMYQVALTAWMYLTPIIYPADIIPAPYRQFLLTLNPMVYLVQIFRQPIYDGVLPSWQMLATGTGIALVTLVAGWLVFSWKANEFTYRT